MARAPTPDIVRLPLVRAATELTPIARLFVASEVFELPPEWLGGDVSLRAFRDATSVEPFEPAWVDVYLTTDPDSTCDQNQYPTGEGPILRAATLGKRLVVGDADRRFWIPRLEDLTPVPEFLYLIASGNIAGLWLEIGLA